MNPRRCPAIHDFTGFKVLQCALDQGHDGPHRPLRFERCSKERFQKLLELARKAKAS